MEDETTLRLRALSKTVFGQGYRLEVMLAVADHPDGLVNLSEIADTVDTSVSNVQKPLQALVQAGLLVEAPRGSDRRRYLLRRESAAWAWARELAEFCQTQPEDWAHTRGRRSGTP